ncbi:MAG: inositol monophosphatase family protein [Candidatus Paceibacterota bacterium]
MNMQAHNKEVSPLTKLELELYLVKAVEIARANGQIMKECEIDITEAQQVLDRAEMNNIKNAATTKTEELLNSLGEEHHLFKHDDTEQERKGFEWICDYIDGAYSYSLGHRVSVTSVALTLDGKSQVAVVYEPWTNRLYAAVRGGGFTVNGKTVALRTIKLEEGTLIDVEWWPWATYDIDTWLHNVSMETHAYVLHIGCIVYGACLVASGVFGAAVLGRTMEGKNHEIAAMKLIVEEAGGIITDLKGLEISHIGTIEGLLIANNGVHGDLLSRVDFIK